MKQTADSSRCKDADGINTTCLEGVKAGRFWLPLIRLDDIFYIPSRSNTP